MQLPFDEEVVEQSADGLGRVAPALVRRCQCETELGLQEVLVQVEAEIPDEYAVQVDGVLKPTGRGRVALDELLDLPHRLGRRHRDVPRLVPGDVGIRSVGRERLGVGEGEAAQGQPLGAREHPAIMSKPRPRLRRISERSEPMKFLLILQGEGEPRPRRDGFERVASDAGELVGGGVLAHPQLAVRMPDREACAPIDGYYLIDVESRERAVELAQLLPDARTIGRSVEVRAVMHPNAADL